MNLYLGLEIGLGTPQPRVIRRQTAFATLTDAMSFFRTRDCRRSSLRSCRMTGDHITLAFPLKSVPTIDELHSMGLFKGREIGAQIKIDGKNRLSSFANFGLRDLISFQSFSQDLKIHNHYSIRGQEFLFPNKDDIILNLSYQALVTAVATRFGISFSIVLPGVRMSKERWGARPLFNPRLDLSKIASWYESLDDASRNSSLFRFLRHLNFPSMTFLAEFGREDALRYWFIKWEDVPLLGLNGESSALQLLDKIKEDMATHPMPIN